MFFTTVIDDTTKEIVYRDYVDISVAVATPKVRLLTFKLYVFVNIRKIVAVQCSVTLTASD